MHQQNNAPTQQNHNYQHQHVPTQQNLNYQQEHVLPTPPVYVDHLTARTREWQKEQDVIQQLHESTFEGAAGVREMFQEDDNELSIQQPNPTQQFTQLQNSLSLTSPTQQNIDSEQVRALRVREIQEK